jgi:hypothetical protein
MNPSRTVDNWPKEWRHILTGILLAFVLGISGCSPITRVHQPGITQSQILESEQQIGQSFVARYGGLESVHFFLAPVSPGEGQIIFHLRSSSDSLEDLGRAVLPIEGLTSPGFYKFDFPALADSQFSYYYTYLEIDGDAQVEVGSGPADSYLEGALYLDHQPSEAQAAFRLGYQPGLLVKALLRTGLLWSRTLLLGVFLFILPGWGLLSLLYTAWSSRSVPEKLALSAGVSLAVYPLLVLWTHLAGLQLGAVIAWLPPLAGLGLLLWQSRPAFRTNPDQRLGFQFPSLPLSLATPRSQHLLPSWSQLAFLAVAGLVVLTRFWAVRALEIPMLGDSYQHTMITQLLVDNGGLFSSWQPYTDLNTFTYHFGFHSAAAAYAWLSGLAAPQSVLWTGQLVNILAVLSLYPLATKIGRSQWAGVGAILVAGLLTSMPMTYTNWGRYTQLAGQAVLPAAIFLFWWLMEAQPVNRGAYILAWITLGGLALIHYRVLIFAILFIPAYFIFYTKKTGMKELLRKLVIAGLGAGILFLPWFVRQFGGWILDIFKANLTTPASQLSEATQQYNAAGELTFYLPLLTWIGLAVVVGWSLWRRERGSVAILTWWALILLATNPHWIGLPGTGSISNFAVGIAAYIPAGILLGAASGWVIERAGSGEVKYNSRRYRMTGALLFLVVCVLGLWGTRHEIHTIDIPVHSLVTRPDLRAAGWIQENLPAEARFLVNSFFAYSGATVVGSDGGWWLPILAGRQTTLPPLSYGLEPEPWPGYRSYINELTAILHEKGPLHPDSLAALRERGVGYVYIGQQQGRVNYSGPNILNPEELLSSHQFKPIYHQDRVWVFEMVD